ncbi:MAG: hypothetical protein SGI92_27360 [Bryobacteraceae bacterium]|nr:hypothetical protein [Bryobacteraceae bacterium]
MRTEEQFAAWEAIQRFVAQAKRPVAFEPGEEPMPLVMGSYEIRLDGTRLLFQVWTTGRNLVRRVTAVASEKAGQLDLTIERFGKRTGMLQLLDVARPAAAQKTKRAGRLAFREHFRRFLTRQFPTWKVGELSCEADLEHSLSPVYPRAFLRKGSTGWAALGAATASDADHALTFGLIWLDYLRRREAKIAVEGLAIFLPEGHEKATCHRIRHLNLEAAKYKAFVHADGWEMPVDVADSGNIDTHLPDRAVRLWVPDWVRALGGEMVDTAGEVSLRVRGLEFARWTGSELRVGIDSKRVVTESGASEIRSLAEEIGRMRDGSAGDHRSLLWSACPERWLESRIRRDLPAIDAGLTGEVYGQAPTFAAGERGVLDLLAAGSDGRLTVLELKASEDIHLPLQALDYWARVKWHLERGEFGMKGYFPGQRIGRLSPRILLVAPALHFHPTTETILRYVTSDAEVERIGLAATWRSELKVVFRARGCEPAGCEDKSEEKHEGSSGTGAGSRRSGASEPRTGSGRGAEAIHGPVVCGNAPGV